MAHRWKQVSLTRVVVMTLIGVLGLYLAAVLLVQRRLLFHPPDLEGVPARPSDAVQIWIPTAAGAVEAWRLPPLQASGEPAPAVASSRAPLIIVFHGNAEVIDQLANEFDEVRRWGIGVLLVEFPGYGRSDRSPSESALTAAAVGAYDWAAASPAVDASRIAGYGRSLGGAVAIALAARRDLRALVVESTFTSIRRFAHEFGVLELAVLDPFDSLAVMEGYRKPVLILHGSGDEVVPLEHGRELANAATQAEFHVLSCGHNDCARPWTIVQEFLRKNGVTPGAAHEL